ncbi:hypothetical protein SFRURICE_008808 [Spodoptera frugiperda]|nr:hypothetical protein SFRURICE_008808 [Spodoptera frugiperda]
MRPPPDLRSTINLFDRFIEEPGLQITTSYINVGSRADVWREAVFGAGRGRSGALQLIHERLRRRRSHVLRRTQLRQDLIFCLHLLGNLLRPALTQQVQLNQSKSFMHTCSYYIFNFLNRNSAYLLFHFNFDIGRIVEIGSICH